MTYFHSIQRQRFLKYLAVFSVGFLGIFLAGMAALAVLPHSQPLDALFSDLSSPIWNLLTTTAFFYAAFRWRRFSPRLSQAWAILGFAQLAYALGDIIWAVLELGLHQNPFPSLADGFYLLYYPLILFAILRMPSRRLERQEWLTTLLDMLIVMLAASLGIWNLLLGPSLHAGAGNSITFQFITLAYPVCDLILLWAILVMIYRKSAFQSQAPLFFLAAGSLLMIVSDFIFSYLSLQGLYQSGGWLDLIWIASNILFGLAGVVQAVQARPPSVISTPALSGAGNERGRIKWTPYIPFLWLAGVYLLLIWGYDHPLPMNFRWLAVGVGAVIGLVLVRQAVTSWENTRLFDQLQNALDQVRFQAIELGKKNEELQIGINKRILVEEKLSHDALHDALTGLPNRTLFLIRLSHALDFSRRQKNSYFAVLFLDMDSFKVINDSLGHDYGDLLLKAIARELGPCLRKSDTFARLGGDEFLILLEGVRTRDDVTHCADRIMEKLAAPFTLQEHQVFVSASIGVVIGSQDGQSAQDILRDADIAMYQAKRLGKSRYEIFTAEMRSQAVARLKLENDLRHAVDHGEFVLQYQPIYALVSNCLLGFEALIRWRSPDRGLVQPSEFIPLAEETGIINALGRWVLYEACRQTRTWQNRYPSLAPLTISVNISSIQLSQPDFINQIEQTLAETELDIKSLILEITEDVCLNTAMDPDSGFEELNRKGVQFQIDDFGTGYSSLSYLQRFPFHAIKIDKSFIRQLGANSRANIVRYIINLAHDLGVQAIAEGVETGEQLEMLKAYGCDCAQGYLFNHPLDPASIDALLASTN